jgi:hypothetical protein
VADSEKIDHGCAATGGHVRFGVLGPVVAHADNREITLKGPKQTALLAVLLSRPNTPIPVDTLADSLWGSRPPPSAHDGVRWHLHQLRRSLGEDRVTRTHKGYLVHVLDRDLDALEFEIDLLDATRALLDGRTDWARETLTHALWRGTPYEGPAFRCRDPRTAVRNSPDGHARRRGDPGVRSEPGARRFRGCDPPATAGNPDRPLAGSDAGEARPCPVPAGKQG